ncbi:MAG: hypothetical protein ABR537_03995 [Gemmatimonadales bacterium]
MFECPGLQSCFVFQGNDEIGCGTTTNYTPYAKANAPCGAENAAGCSFAKDIVLICISGRWVEAIHCPPSNCDLLTNSVGQPSVQCANGGYSVGDICSFSGGGVVCSTDLTKILSCSNGRTVVLRDCGSLHCARVNQNGQTVLACQ